MSKSIIEMKKQSELLKKYSTKLIADESLTINDLREKEFSGDKLSLREKQALVNFDRYRINELNAQEDDMAFHRRSRELQVIANLGEYEEFLKEKYFI